MHRQCFKERSTNKLMKIELSKRPRKPVIIGGFPGFGLVGMIATEYLINHLDTVEIGRIWSKNLPPITGIERTLAILFK